jgi:alpha/beta hydrolase fold
VSKHDNSNSTATPSLLSSLLPTSTIITLNYRLSPPNHLFPSPIHDTTIAFNHILRTFTNHPNQSHPRISLLGTHIGGTLATTLALTKSNSLHSIAVTSPITDWVSLDTGHEEDPSFPFPQHIPTPPATPNKRKAKPPPPHQYSPSDAHSLLTLRSQLFRNPDSYFDPFASPTLFLRAPGRDCPQSDRDFEDPASQGKAFAPYNDENTYSHSRSLSTSAETTTTTTDEDEVDPNAMRPVRRRKVLRRWPPHGQPEDVQLPHFRVWVSDDRAGEGKVLRQQAGELVELMRRVCFYGQERGFGEERVGMEVVERKNGEENDGHLLGIERAARWLDRMQREDG